MAVDLTRFLPMFFQETEEHLVRMEALLLKLDPGMPDAETLHSLLRAAHSVKGNSTMLGAARFAEIMHRVESILERVKRKALDLHGEVISALLDACDRVRDGLAQLKDIGTLEEQPLDAAYERLLPFVEQQPEMAPGTGPAKSIGPATSERVRVEVDLPPGQGITGLPLAELYSQLGALGRLEDVGTSDKMVSFILLAAQPTEAIRQKLHAMLGAVTCRIEPHRIEHRHAEPDVTPLQAATKESSYGLFRAEQSTTQTSFGRRAGDPEATVVFGRRATDRVGIDRSSIRVDVDKLDRLLNLVGELVIAHSMLGEAAQRSTASGDGRLRDSIAYLGRQTRDLQEAVMDIRLLPIDFLFSRVPRLVRDLAARLGKEVEFTALGAETELDKEMIEKLADPLVHLVRNSLDHGIERPQAREAAGKRRAGQLTLRATHQAGSVMIEIEDDGAGLDREKILATAAQRGMAVHAGMSDEEVWQLVFASGFTTADEVNDISGRGVGMDIVKRNINSLGGQIDIRSRSGAGTCVSIRLPLTLAIVDGMNVEIGGNTFIVPLSSIAEAFLPQLNQVKSVAGHARLVQIRDSYLPLLPLEPLLGVQANSAALTDSIVIVLDMDGRRAALPVDRLLGQQQVVIKSVEANYRRVPGVAAATVLGNGRVAFILDVNALVRAGERDASASAQALAH